MRNLAYLSADEVISTLRAHDAELRGAGVRHLSVLVQLPEAMPRTGVTSISPSIWIQPHTLGSSGFWLSTGG